MGKLVVFFEPVGELVDSDPLWHPGAVVSVVEVVDRDDTGVQDVLKGDHDLLSERGGSLKGGLDSMVEHWVKLAVNDGSLFAKEEIVRLYVR